MFSFIKYPPHVFNATLHELEAMFLAGCCCSFPYIFNSVDMILSMKNGSQNDNQLKMKMVLTNALFSNSVAWFPMSF